MKNNQIDTLNDDAIIESALTILEKRISYSTEAPSMTSPQASKDYVKLQLAEYEHEVFACLFLDTRHRIITYEELFRGTIDGASVHPREVVRRALQHNAAAVIFAHNHPSGDPEPSSEDVAVTRQLVFAGKVMGLVVHEHIIIGDNQYYSFADQGHIESMNREFEKLTQQGPNDFR